MRSVGLGLAFLATALMIATPVLAADPEGVESHKKLDAAPVVVAPAPAPAVPPGHVTVHIDSPDAQVGLEKRTGGASWEHVCNSPCDGAVSVSDEYRIVGTGLNDSKPFMIDATQGDKVTINVTPGKHSKATAGLWILGGGGALAVAGTIVILAGSSSNQVPGDSGTETSTKNTNIITVGTILIVGGVVAAITGGAMAIDNAHTQVGGAVATAPEHPKDKSGPLSVQVTADRLPTWHESAGRSLQPSTVVPILQGTF